MHSFATSLAEGMMYSYLSVLPALEEIELRESKALQEEWQINLDWQETFNNVFNNQSIDHDASELDAILAAYLSSATRKFDKQIEAIYKILLLLFYFPKNSASPVKKLSLSSIFRDPARLNVAGPKKHFRSPLLTPRLALLKPFAGSIEDFKLNLSFKSESEALYTSLLLSILIKDDSLTEKMCRQLKELDLPVFSEATTFKDEDTFQTQKKLIYGIGILAVLSGNIAFLNQMLQENAHHLDKKYLQYILPSMIHLLYTEQSQKFKKQNQQSLSLIYLDELEKLLQRGIPFSQDERNQLVKSYQQFSTDYFCVLHPDEDTGTLSTKIDKLSINFNSEHFAWKERYENYIAIGSICSIDLISLHLENNFSMENGAELSAFIAGKRKFIKNMQQEIDAYFNKIIIALLGKIVGFILTLPKIPQFWHYLPQLSSLLRAAFPIEYLKGLDLHLSESELLELNNILTVTERDNLCKSIQPYHIEQIPQIKKLFSRVLILKTNHTEVKAKITEQGLILLETDEVQPGYLREGLDHIYEAARFFSSQQYFTEVKQRKFPIYEKTIDSLTRFLGATITKMTSGLPEDHVPVIQFSAGNNNIVGQLHPHQDNIKKQQARFIPIAVLTEEGYRGIYVRFSQSPEFNKVPKISPKNFLLAGCRFGASLEASVSNHSKAKVVLTDPALSLDRGAKITDIQCTADIHPDELMFLLVNEKILGHVYKQCANQEGPINLFYLKIGANYINYLFKLFFMNQMDQNVLAKGCDIILKRDKKMCDYMAQFATHYGFTFTLTSSLDLIGFERLLYDHTDNFMECLMEKLHIPMKKWHERDILQPEAFEDYFVLKVIEFLASKEMHHSSLHAEVWTFIKENLESIFDKLKLRGLQGLNIISYIAEFAITKRQYPTEILMIALQEREQHLQIQYEDIFKNYSGPLCYLNWLDPVWLHSKNYKNRMYFFDEDIPLLNQMIRDTFPYSSELIAGKALDDSALVLQNIEALYRTLENISKLSRAQEKRLSL